MTRSPHPLQTVLTTLLLALSLFTVPSTTLAEPVYQPKKDQVKQDQVKQQQALNDIVWMTEVFPPFNYLEEGKLTGIFVDILIQMYARVGITKTVDEIQLVPWVRGYQTLLNKPNTALFTMAKNEQRELLGFHWVGGLVTPDSLAVMAKASKNYHIQSIDDINNKFAAGRIGVVKDGSATAEFLQHGGHADRLHNVISGANLVQMLAADRFDGIIFPYSTTLRLMKQYHMDPAHYPVVYQLTDTNSIRQGFFALHKDTDPAIVELLQSKYQELQFDGTMAKILAKYQ